MVFEKMHGVMSTIDKGKGKEKIVLDESRHVLVFILPSPPPK